MLNPTSNSVYANKEQETKTIYKTADKIVFSQQKEAQDISLRFLLGKFLRSMQIPWISAKHQLLLKYQEYMGNKAFPWFKVSLLALGAYMVFQKDMNFQIHMKSPSSIVTDDRQYTDEPTAMSMSLPSFSKAKKVAKKESTIAHLGLTQESVDRYIKRFSRIAVMEMQKFQIPASIKMGQGILTSNAGSNILATTFNNHFGVLCGQSNTCTNYESTAGRVKVKTYESAWEGWRDHSLMLSKVPYNTLAEACGRDYKKWAKSIAALGYGNNQEYVEQLIEVIETYQLHKLDKINEGM